MSWHLNHEMICFVKSHAFGKNRYIDMIVLNDLEERKPMILFEPLNVFNQDICIK